MSHSSAVRVLIDDRIRLMSAALAATDYPQAAQDRKRHHAHAHARQTMKYLADNGHKNHEAIVQLQAMLDKGVSLQQLFSAIMTWPFPGLVANVLPAWMPPHWNRALWDFYESSALANFWDSPQSHKAWDDALNQAKRILVNTHFKALLESFLGTIHQELLFVPNIGYPADSEVGAQTETQLISIVPPPLAWGESPPWPYDEETNITHSYRAALFQYSRLLLTAYLRQHEDRMAEITQRELPVTEQMKANYPTWEEQFIVLFNSAAVAIYLEDYVSRAEANAYILMEKRTHGMTLLPGTISVLRRFLQERGHKFNGLIDFLPVFPAQLRVAKRIVTM